MSSQFPSEQQFKPYYPEPPKSSGSGIGAGLLIGCLGVFLLCVVMCAGGVWYVQRNVDRWAMTFVREALVAVVNESQIPAQEKTEIVGQVDRVVNAYKARKISQEDLERVMEELQDSSAFSLILLHGTGEQYLDDSGLSEDEKTAGRRVFERALRGIYEEKIAEEDFYAALPDSFESDLPHKPADVDEAPPAADVVAESGEANAEAMEGEEYAVTDEQVRASLKKLKTMADEAEIPDEPFVIDFGDEVKKAVDAALSGKNVP